MASLKFFDVCRADGAHLRCCLWGH